MGKLSIDFQDGFQGEDVEVSIDGKPAADLKKVKTSLLTGLAHSAEFDVPSSPARVEVSVPGRSLQKSVEVTGDEDFFLGVRIEDEKLILTPSGRPFGYM